MSEAAARCSPTAHRLGGAERTSNEGSTGAPAMAASAHAASPPLPSGLHAAHLGRGHPQTSPLSHGARAGGQPTALLPPDLRLPPRPPHAPHPGSPLLSAPDQSVLFILLIQNFGSNGTIKNQAFWAMSIYSFKPLECSQCSCGVPSTLPTLVHPGLTAELPSH